MSFIFIEPFDRAVEMIAITLDQLSVLVAVAEEGSLSAAARRLRRTQSAVSYAVDNLERLLDVQVLDRSGYRPALTSAGLSVLAHAHAVLSEARRLEASARLIHQSVEAEISVAVDAVFPPQVLSRALMDFRDAFPTVRVSLRLESKWSVTQLVLDRECDFGICGPLARLPPGLDLKPLRLTEFIPVVSARHELARFRERVPAAALRRYPRLVLAERDLRYRAEERVAEGLVWRFADYELKHRCILEGLGWGFMPRDWVAADLTRRRLKVLRLTGENVRPALLSSIQRTQSPAGPAGQWLLSRLAGPRAK